jgi:beta-lactamase regulating signal transducer with metallopeptidase domain
MDALNDGIVLLNQVGRACCDFAGRMFIQSGVLVGLLLVADLCLRARVSARFRYALWLLVLVKLVLPPSLALPTGATYWLGPYLPSAPGVLEREVPPQLPVPAEPIGLESHIGAVPTATGATVASRSIAPLQWPAMVLLVWIGGSVLLLALVLWRVATLRRSLRRSRPAPPHVVALLEECLADLGVTGPVTLRVTENLRSPALCGFVRPVILLPATLPAGLWPDGLRTILTHELAHVKRRDPWVSLAQTALQIAYFWHPLVWVTNARLRHLRELAVDETVLTALRSQAQCYTNTLIDIAELAFRKPAFNVRMIGIAESRRDLERRITHMLNWNLSRRRALGLSGLLTILAIGAVLVPMGRPTPAAHAEPAAAPTVPALPEGIAEMFELSKDAILEVFGEPEHIFYGDQRYTLDNLPETYFLPYEDLSFCVHEDAVVGITLLSPGYVFGNGIRVGDSEEKVKQAFGPASELEETEFKDFLIYDQIGLSFEVNKQDRSVMEINIKQDYGDLAQLEAYARAAEFAAQLPQKIAKFDIDSANLAKVIATFGPPLKYIWGPKTLPPDDLPRRFIAVYPGRFHVFMLDDRIVEMRHERGSTYVFAGKLRVGSTLEEALAVLGPPAETIVGEPIDWRNAKNVLFKDIEGREGHCYYHRPDRKVRVWFGNYKVAAIYMTRSDYGEHRSGPFDSEFGALLPARILALDIDSADRNRVLEVFGDPIRYLWGDKTFTPDALPENYIMDYPCDFSAWLKNDRIMEIRHGDGSQYAYGGTLRIGATVQEALELLGQPDEVVRGKNEYEDRVLYRDIDGKQGHCYYRRADQNVRIWFSNDRVIAIYMTRSDFPH